MENKNETVTIFHQKKLEDADLDNVVGGAGTADVPQHKAGDIVHIVVNQTPAHLDVTKVITLQGQIVGEPYYVREWYYDVLILAQDAFYEGYRSMVGDTMTYVSDRVIAGATRYMAENGITFK